MLRFAYGMVLTLLVAVGARGETGDDAAIRRAVVKVWATQNGLSFTTPWQRGEGREVSGSGVWLGERRVLTNAHVVDRATQCFIQTSESSDRLPVTVKVLSHDVDLAILELDDEEAFAELQPLELMNTVPRLRTTVRVYGYPEGGTTLSVTEGIVSRIEFLNYLSGVEALRIQIDAAINHGNSGGPAIIDGKIVGVAFQKQASADNIGYLIPGEEIQLFLDDVADGKYDGKRLLRLGWQRLQNRALRDKLGVPKEVTGLLVSDLGWYDEGAPIRVGDIVTHLGDHVIDNSGIAKLNDEIKLDFRYFTNQLQASGQAPLRVRREGASQTVDLPLLTPPPSLLRELKGGPMDWFVHGPYVYVEATSDLMRGLETLSAVGDPRQRLGSIITLHALSQRQSPILRRRWDEPEFPGEQLVVVANTLPHRIHTGYTSPTWYTVRQVNGQDVQNLRHLAELLRDCRDEFVTLTYCDRNVETHVFRPQELEAATLDVMNDVGIPRRSSPNLAEVWERKE